MELSGPRGGEGWSSWGWEAERGGGLGAARWRGVELSGLVGGE